ncbi:thiamine diphosphokinase [Mucilaginibacter sp.]|uniref:thiamine diphosphokinase n=1 Tax=Mucilaginibacter sp. TaxID=1882438 RepID=UPI0035BC6B3B
MSSHHIIREKQEPALLILGLDNFDDEFLGQLLEWSPTIITTPLTAEQMNSQGIRVDIVISNDVLDVQSDVRLIKTDGNVVATVLDFLIANDYKAVNIITDDFRTEDFLRYADKINLVIFFGDKKIYPVTTGFSKWKPAAEIITVLSPFGSLQATGLTLSNAANYHTIADGFFTLRFNEPFLFISEDI